MTQRFSERFGVQPVYPEITVREDAPDNLRYAVAQIAVDAGFTPTAIREVICGVLFVRPDAGNWSEYPNIWDEVQHLLSDCPWYNVYDIAEVLHSRIQTRRGPPGAELFRNELNRLFYANGIGWQFSEDKIVFRGGEAFTAATKEAGAILMQTGRARAANEIHEALRDISRRPKPDITGAIQHAMGALECTARDVLGAPNQTLGTLLPYLNLPKPLDVAVDRLWGFACDKARHVREGDQVGDMQAELIVSVACAICTFIAQQKRA